MYIIKMISSYFCQGNIKKAKTMKTALTTVKTSKKSTDTSLLWVEKTLVISCCGQ